MAATGSGANQVVSTVTATNLSDSISVTADFTAVCNTPLTIDYYSGGPNGTLVYSEQSANAGAASLSMGGGLAGSIFPDTFYTDNTGSWWQVWKYTAGLDRQGPAGGFDQSITTAGGTVLPASDNINFIDFLATPIDPTALGPYSSVDLTAGGGISSFTVTGEAVATPEPSTLALLAACAIGLLGYAWRRRRQAA